MTKNEVMAIKGLSAEQKEAAERIFAMVERTRGTKISNKLLPLTTDKEVKDYLTKAVEQRAKRQAAARKKAAAQREEAEQMKELKSKLKEFKKYGFSLADIIAEVDAKIAAKVNEKTDAKIAALKEQIAALEAQRK